MSYKIVMEFESAYEAIAALEHIGEKDAPVFLTTGSYFETAFGNKYKLWEDFDRGVSMAKLANRTDEKEAAENSQNGTSDGIISRKKQRM